MPSLRSTTQLPRHAPPSLSLGSLGVFKRMPRKSIGEAVEGLRRNPRWPHLSLWDYVALVRDVYGYPAAIVLCLKMFLGTLVGAALLFLIAAAIGKMTTPLNGALVATLRIAMPIVVVVCGFILYRIRTRRRQFYASVEMGAAIASGYTALSALSPSASTMQFMIPFLGSLYLAVRALDNLEQDYQDVVGKATSHFSELMTEADQNRGKQKETQIAPTTDA